MARRPCYIDERLQYACDSCGTLLTAEQLLAYIKYSDIVYKRIQEFPDYYVSKCGNVLSLKTKRPSLLKYGLANKKYKKKPTYIVRLTDRNKFIGTRSVAKLVKITWGED